MQLLTLALAIADDEGTAGLSMRTVARIWRRSRRPAAIDQELGLDTLFETGLKLFLDGLCGA